MVGRDPGVSSAVSQFSSKLKLQAELGLQFGMYVFPVAFSDAVPDAHPGLPTWALSNFLMNLNIRMSASLKNSARTTFRIVLNLETSVQNTALRMMPLEVAL